MTNTPKTIEDLDILRAKSAREHWRDDCEIRDDTLDWDLIEPGDRECWLDTARAIREADAAAGLVTVPREATEEMLAANHCECGSGHERDEYMREDYRAMLLASPFHGDENA